MPREHDRRPFSGSCAGKDGCDRLSEEKMRAMEVGTLHSATDMTPFGRT